jgi:Fe2+ or Zn2+ uptake regulation protein
VAQEQEFRVTGHRLIVHGICAECGKSRRRTKRKADSV